MTYMKINNVNIRENGKKRNLFDRVNELKKQIYMIVPEIDGEKLISIMSHLRREVEGKYYYGRHGTSNRKLELTNNERLIKEILLKEGINPSTCYRWFLAARIPSDVMLRLRNGQISQKKAYEIAVNRKRNQKSSDNLIMMESMREIVRRY